jgi:hypothetical protein
MDPFNPKHLPESTKPLEAQLMEERPPITRRPTTAAIFKFAGLAFLFNLLLFSLGFFAQLRGWVNMTASYLTLGVMGLIGIAICIVLAFQFLPERRKLAATISSSVWIILLLGLNAIAPKPKEAPPFEIWVHALEIGWIDKQERIVFGPTDEALPGSVWAANVRYVTSASHNISIAYQTELVVVAGATKSDREQMENDHWKKFVSSADYSTQQRSLAGAPSFTTFRGPRLDKEPLKWLADHKAALYIFGIFADRENELIKPVMAVCFYREGKSDAVHFCDSHNGPI